ncbi:MAG: SH3 domain-containing protein [Chloroflexi bacterium]|nr:SH3 domain-containing protein [Chloroflexota bacterium]
MKARWLFVLLLAALFTPTMIAAQSPGEDTRQIRAEDASNLGVLTLLAGHEEPIIEKRFSPGGTAFVTGSLDSTFCVWHVKARDAAPGTALMCLPNYSAGVTTHAWSAEEDSIAITSGDGLSIAIYDTLDPAEGTPEPKTEIPPGEAVYLQMAFVAEDTNLLVYDVFDTFTLIDLATGETLTSYEGIEHAISPDREQIAIVTFDGETFLLDSTTGEIIDTLNTEGATHAVFDPEGQYLATWGEQTLIWDLSHDTPDAEDLDTDMVDNATFSPAGQYLATWEGDTIRLWESDSGNEAGSMPEHDGGVSALVFSPNGERAISIDTTGKGRLWDIDEAGNVSQLLLFRDNIDGVAISPDSTTAIVTRLDFFARFYDIEAGQLRGRYEAPADSLISPDWTLIAINAGPVISWHGLRDDPREFAWMPVGELEVATNVRQTPSTELARISVLPAGAPIFAFERTADSDWLHILLPDSTAGWIFATNLQNAGDLEALPVADLPPAEDE